MPVRAYLDLDPAFNQLWQASGIDMRFGGHTHFVTVGQAIGTPACPVPTLRAGLDPDRAARGARALAARAGRRGPARRIHHGRELARLRVGRARGRALRAEGALDAGADADPDAHRRGSAPGARRSIPARRPTSRRSTATAGSCSTPRRSPARPGLLPRVRGRLAGRVRRREERLRALALRVVQRSQRLLPRVRQAGAGAGDRLRRPTCPPARGCSRSQAWTTRSPAIEEIAARLRAPCRTPRARWRRSTSTPTACWRGCSTGWAAT